MDDIPFGLILFLLLFIVPAIWGSISKSETVRRRLNLPTPQPEAEAPRPRARPRSSTAPRPSPPPAGQRRQRNERIAGETGRASEEVEWREDREVPRRPPILPPPRPAPRLPLLTTRAGLRQAILMQEILGPPKALQGSGRAEGNRSAPERVEGV